MRRKECNGGEADKLRLVMAGGYERWDQWAKPGAEVSAVRS